MKKKSIGQLKKALWKVFSEYIRKRDKGICISCGRYAEGSGYHAGHFVPKSVGGLTLYFDEENAYVILMCRILKVAKADIIPECNVL